MFRLPKMRVKQFCWAQIESTPVLCCTPRAGEEIQKVKKFSANEAQTFKEWFKENVVTSDKFLKSIEYGQIYHHVWEMVGRGGVFEIKEFNQYRKDRE